MLSKLDLCLVRLIYLCVWSVHMTEHSGLSTAHRSEHWPLVSNDISLRV